MSSFKFGRFSRLGLAGGGASVAMAAVIVACNVSSQQPVPVAAEEPVATLSAAITGSSCQAKDISAYFTDTENGGSTNFAVDPSGNVVGWGFNGAPYPLGFNNGIAAIKSPTALGLTNATKIAAHQQGACALTNPTGATGTVVCLGQPLGGDALTPGATVGLTNAIVTTVSGSNLTGAVGIAAGMKHACALLPVGTAGGNVWCWGSDYYGQLGDGSDPTGGNVEASTAQAVPMLDANGNPLTDVIQVAAAENTTCVLHSNNTVQCVGSNGAGELGQGGGAVNGTPTGLLTAILAPPGALFGSLFGGGEGNGLGSLEGGTFCATTVLSGAAQTTYCWGYNGNGQAAITNVNSITSPSQVSTSVGSSWAAGPLNGCEVTSAGAVRCWGANTSGEIPGGTVESPLPVETTIPGVTSALKVTLGHEHMCALGLNNLWCWGNNPDGELGNGTSTNPAAGAISSVYIGQPYPVCPANAQCGSVSNTCGDKVVCGGGAGDCNGGVETGAYACTNYQCVKNLAYCSPACGTGEVCENNACVTYCGANAITSATVGTTMTFPLSGELNSPATYGSNGCSAYIVDLTNATNADSDVFEGFPTTPPTNATDCANSFGTTTFYANGNQVGTSQKSAGQWLASGSSGFCNYAPSIKAPHGYANLRVVVSAETGTSVKGTIEYSYVPVTVGSLPACILCGL